MICGYLNTKKDFLRCRQFQPLPTVECARCRSFSSLLYAQASQCPSLGFALPWKMSFTLVSVDMRAEATLSCQLLASHFPRVGTSELSWLSIKKLFLLTSKAAFLRYLDEGNGVCLGRRVLQSGTLKNLFTFFAARCRSMLSASFTMRQFRIKASFMSTTT